MDILNFITLFDFTVLLDVLPALPPGDTGSIEGDTQLLVNMDHKLEDLFNLALYFTVFVAFALGFSKAGQL